MPKTKSVPYIIQQHNAYRAGRHYDLRIKYPQRMKLASWALPKGRVPTTPGDKVLAARTEDHGMYWLKFEGKIESGYGAGEIKIIEKGKVEILEWTENKIIFRGNQKFINGKYALVRTKFGGRKKNGQESWILLKSKYEDH